MSLCLEFVLMYAQSGSVPDYSSVESSTTRPSPGIDLPPSGSTLSVPSYAGLHHDRYRLSPQPSTSHVFSRTIFEGSPAYKRRRVRSRQGTSPSVIDDGGVGSRRPSPMPVPYVSNMRRPMMVSPRIYPRVFRKVSGLSRFCSGQAKRSCKLRRNGWRVQ